MRNDNRMITKNADSLKCGEFCHTCTLRNHFCSCRRTAGPNHVYQLLTCSVSAWLCVHTKYARNAPIMHVWWIFTDLGVRTRPFLLVRQNGWAESCATTSHMLSECLAMYEYQIRQKRTSIACMVEILGERTWLILPVQHNSWPELYKRGSQIAYACLGIYSICLYLAEIILMQCSCYSKTCHPPMHQGLHKNSCFVIHSW